MEILNKKKAGKQGRPIKVVQFGEGNFLRGFVDYMIDIANEKKCFNGDIIILNAIRFGSLDLIRQQEHCYTVLLRGLEGGTERLDKRIVTSVADSIDVYEEYDKYSALAKLDTLRFVVSNTTEAGIVFDVRDKLSSNPPDSFPAKLTKFLYERYLFFKGDMSKGLIILPVELIEDNGLQLKNIVNKLAIYWELGEDFLYWLKEACIFCSTLVDRIITGYPKEEAESLCREFGYRDNLIVTGEPFGLWVIESDKEIEQEFPLIKAGLPVVFTNDHKPYKQRKVRILNGAHTSFSMVSYLAGNDYVLESMQDPKMKEFIRRTIYEEIIPTLSLSKEELTSFTKAVTDRFQNPFIKHSLLSITLNSVSKWRARCMPSFLDYVERFNQLPPHITFSLAALYVFYSLGELRGDSFYGRRGNEEYQIIDDKEVLSFFVENRNKPLRQALSEFLSSEAFWGQDLSKVPNFVDTIEQYVSEIQNKGIRIALEDNKLV